MDQGIVLNWPRIVLKLPKNCSQLAKEMFPTDQAIIALNWPQNCSQMVKEMGSTGQGNLLDWPHNSSLLAEELSPMVKELLDSLATFVCSC